MIKKKKPKNPATVHFLEKKGARAIYSYCIQHYRFWCKMIWRYFQKLRKKPFLTCRLLRQGHPLSLLPANLQYWGLHSQRAVYIVHCRHFSFLQLPFVLPNKTHSWCIVYGTLSLQTIQGRQRAIQFRQCQVDSHWESGPSFYYIQVASGTASQLSMWWSWKVSDQRFCSSPHSTNTTL